MSLPQPFARADAVPHAEADQGVFIKTCGGGAPGAFFGTESAERCAAFLLPWRYRQSTYEIYYGEHEELARASYALALHARDIDLSLPRESYEKGVLGFHYSANQVCAWLNDMAAGKSPDPAPDQARLAWALLRDGVIAMRGGVFVPAGGIRHILAASAGKKRSFAATLLHERLHVFWDEDRDFQERMRGEWRAMPDEGRAAAKKALSRYAADNTEQLLEEWAVRQAERRAMDLR